MTLERKKKRIAWSEIRVGFFVIISFAILLFLLFRVGGGRGFFTPKVMAVTYLPNVSGLKPGAAVWLNGIEIGNVERIQIEPNLPDTQANRSIHTKVQQMRRDIQLYAETLKETKAKQSSLNLQLGQAKPRNREMLSLQSRENEQKLLSIERTIQKLQDDVKESQNNLQSIKVILQIEKGYEGWIKRDSEVTIGSIGLLGDKYIDISIGRGNELCRKTSEGYINIEGVSEATIRQLMTGANEVMAGFGDITNHVRNIITKMDNGEGTIGQIINTNLLHEQLLTTVKSLDQTVIKAGQVFDDIHSSQGTMGQLIRNRELYEDLHQTITELKTFSRQLNQYDGTVNRLIRDPSLYQNLSQTTARINSIATRMDEGQGTLGKLTRDDKVYTELHGTLTRLHSVLKQMDEGNGSVGVLLKDRKLYDNLTQTIGELGKLVEAVRKEPKKYLRIKFSIF